MSIIGRVRRLVALVTTIAPFLYACDPHGTTAGSGAESPVSPDLSASTRFDGTASRDGMVFDWTLILDPDGRAYSEVGGADSQITGFDGRTVWRIDRGAGPYRLDFAEREVWLIMLWLLSESAAKTSSLLPVEESAEGHLRTTDGLLQFELDSNGAWVAANSPNRESITAVEADPGSSDDRRLTIYVENIGRISEYRVDSRRIDPTVSSDRFSKPSRSSSGVRFLAGLDSELATRRAASGHLFVRPRIVGRERGWFLFDSGAGFSGISGDLAEKLNFQVVGTTDIGGVGGTRSSSHRYRGGPVQLGPLEIEELEFLDVGGMTKARRLLGEPVVGVLGWDILIRSIVGVDLRDGRLFIRDPASYRVPAQYRYPLFLHWKVPYTLARFEGERQGPFMLDTGAGNRGIIFTRFSTERFDLLASRPGQTSISSGAGGEVESLIGEIDWFEVGGRRISPAPATFFLSEDNESDLFTIGFLGGAVVSPFQLWFDYSRAECGFVPRQRPAT